MGLNALYVQENEDSRSEYFNLRVQRSLSWLRKAVELQADYDFQFLSLWIGLNALYVQENEDS
ncbi:hypothetical protein EKL28_18750, partial [Staphylococcus aureus]